MTNLGAYANGLLYGVANAISSPVYAPLSEKQVAADADQAQRDNADWFNQMVGACA